VPPIRVWLVRAAAVIALVLGGFAVPAPASAAVRTIYYDVTEAAEFTQAVHDAVAIWNAKLTKKARFAPATAATPATVVIRVDEGWPRTYADAFGEGYIYLGRQAVRDGFNVLRVMAHEFGHILGLPDQRDGGCAVLMSGKDGGRTCANAKPSAAEIAQVTKNAADPGTFSTMIVGGGNVTGAYSFMASLQSAGAHFCGGTLIAARWVLTARHCVNPASSAPFQVRIGATAWNKGGVLANSVSVSRHWDSDIALVKLDRDVPLALACPTVAASATVGHATRILGWGQTCPTAGCGNLPTKLQQLDAKTVDDARCGLVFSMTADAICVGDGRAASGACFGDSGGPALVRANGAWALVGTTSRSGGTDTCGEGPTVYVDVPYLRSWITQTINRKPPTA
jgi:snapalysin